MTMVEGDPEDELERALTAVKALNAEVETVVDVTSFFTNCGMLNSVYWSFRFLATLSQLRNSRRKPALKVKQSRRDNVTRTLFRTDASGSA